LSHLAKKNFGTNNVKKKNKNNTLKKENKSWFDLECRFARQNYRKLKKCFKCLTSPQNRLAMIHAEKHYKHTLDRKYKNYRKKFSEGIQNLSRNNPKEFWKLLNKDKRKKQPNIEIDKLYDFFSQNLNIRDICDGNDGLPEFNILQNEPINEHINAYISKEEILKCIQKLKNEKACGEDEIINKYIKSTSNQFINIYEKLFNIIFDKGLVPHIWLIGTIKSIHKNKGDIDEPKNHRPITIVSCLGKLFTSILNIRLNTFSEEYKLIKENQFRFRQNYSTIDNIFSLFLFFQIIKLKKRKLFCAFINFEKAFDMVWREGLLYNNDVK
jgi:hypothetical protein